MLFTEMKKEKHADSIVYLSFFFFKFIYSNFNLFLLIYLQDKLKEHVKRMHAPGSTATVRNYTKDPNAPPVKKFVPRAMPSEYQRFIYKVSLCALYFTVASLNTIRV